MPFVSVALTAVSLLWLALRRLMTSYSVRLAQASQRATAAALPAPAPRDAAAPAASQKSDGSADSGVPSSLAMWQDPYNFVAHRAKEADISFGRNPSLQ